MKHYVFMKTIKIQCFISISQFLWKNFFVWLLYFFAPPKTWFLDLHQIKIMCTTDFKMLFVKNHMVKNSKTIFFVQKLEIIQGLPKNVPLLVKLASKGTLFWYVL